MKKTNLTTDKENSKVIPYNVVESARLKKYKTVDPIIMDMFQAGEIYTSVVVENKNNEIALLNQEIGRLKAELEQREDPKQGLMIKMSFIKKK